MSFKTVECKVAECDMCNESYENGDGMILHWQSPEIPDLYNDDWYTDETIVLCPNCREKYPHECKTDDDRCEICLRDTGSEEE